MHNCAPMRAMPNPPSVAPLPASIEFAPTFRAHWPIRHVLFDFDGTLSLVRAGWADVMTDMFVAHLGESHRASARDNIMRLNGKPTIHQMQWLADTIGLGAADSRTFLDEFLAHLQRVIDTRLAAGPSRLLVHGTIPLLDALQERDLTLHLASGTDERAVRHEADLLGIAHYFGNRLHGAPADARPFSKRAVIDSILHDHGLTGDALLSFGDGHVEIEETKAVGGLAVAVASDEETPGSGLIDESKRTRLLACGADVIIPDYRDAPALLTVLLPA